MPSIILIVMSALAFHLGRGPSPRTKAPGHRLKGLDEQVQRSNCDVLSIAAELTSWNRIALSPPTRTRSVRVAGRTARRCASCRAIESMAISPLKYLQLKSSMPCERVLQRVYSETIATCTH